MKRIKLIALTLCLFLVTTTFSFGQKADVVDPEPGQNMTPGVMWEARESDPLAFHLVSDDPIGPTGEAMSGNFILAYVQVKPGVGYLASWDDIINIKLTNSEGTDFEINLSQIDNLIYDGRADIRSYSLFFRADNPWMFTGTWKFTMIYKGTDGLIHKQKTSYDPPVETFPYVPKNIRIFKGTSGFEVTWQGIGDPWIIDSYGYRRINYNVRLYEKYLMSFTNVQTFKGDWMGTGSTFTGTYDPNTNRVTFLIPYDWTFSDGKSIKTSGKELRLESYSGVPRKNRGVKYIRLP